jgi:nucleoside-diphosphate kinase
MDMTLTFLKPDVFEKNLYGKVIAEIESHGIKIIAAKMLRLTKKQAGHFYKVHEGKKFYEDLVSYVTRGPIMVLVLAGENVISKYRHLMGATDPAKATHETIRGKYGSSLENNVVHGSDSPEAAKEEISFFFNALEILNV